MDLTKITTPFGLLDAETRKALRAHGGPYEWLTWSGAWEETDPPGWTACYAYRVKPQPPKPREWWIDPKTDVVLDYTPDSDGSFQESGYIHVREVLE